MDAFVTGPQYKEGPWGYPFIELTICENFEFYWDGTGEAYLSSVPYSSWGWNYFEIHGQLTIVLNGSEYLLGGLNVGGWVAASFNLVNDPAKNIHIGLNQMSLYLRDHWTTEIGIRPDIWVVGPGITPANVLDIGIPQFQFQIGIEPPGE